MAVLGDNTTPGSGFWFDTTTNKEFWIARQFTMPYPGGYITDLNVYAAGDGASTTYQIVIWDSSSNIVLQTGNQTLPSGTRAIGGQSWQRVTISPHKYLAPGNYEVGFWASGAIVWTFEGSGGVHFVSGISSPQPNTGANDEYGGGGEGEIGAYANYILAPDVRIRRSGAWVNANPFFIRRSGVWQQVEAVNIRRSGAWVAL